MAFIENKLTYNELIKLTKNGIQIASFYQIKNAFEQMWKDTYGSDIDLSIGTIDNQCIMHFALIYFNLLQTIKGMSINFDTSSADSKYLDILYKLTNFKRESATHSVCYCYAKYNGDEENVYENTAYDGNDYQYMYFIDDAGNKWTWKEYKVIKTNVTSPQSESVTSIYPTNFGDKKIHILKFECESYGNVNLLSNGIDKTNLENSLTEDNKIKNVDSKNKIKLWLYDNADVGESEETDIEFRNRKFLDYQEQRQNPIMELYTELSSIKGIQDVIIYCGSTTSNDNTNVASGSVYIVLRYDEDVELNSYEIAKCIYDNLTPGISTSCTVSSTVSNYIQREIINIYKNVIYQKIYWKKAPVQNLEEGLKIYFMYESDIYIKSKKEEVISKAICDYFNNLKFVDTAIISDLISLINQYDVMINNKNTYLAYRGGFGNNGSYNDTVLLNQDSYFKINEDDYDFEFKYPTKSESEYIYFGETTYNAYVIVKKKSTQGA